LKNVIKDKEKTKKSFEKGNVDSLLANFRDMRGQEGIAEDLLKAQGIPGIKYFDEFSRGKGYEIKLSTKKGNYETDQILFPTRKEAEQEEKIYQKKGFQTKTIESGTRNYVIFDDRIIEISKKYGIPIPTAAILLSESTGENPANYYQEDQSV